MRDGGVDPCDTLRGKPGGGVEEEHSGGLRPGFVVEDAAFLEEEVIAGAGGGDGAEWLLPGVLLRISRIGGGVGADLVAKSGGEGRGEGLVAGLREFAEKRDEDGWCARLHVEARDKRELAEKPGALAAEKPGNVGRGKPVRLRGIEEHGHVLDARLGQGGVAQRAIGPPGAEPRLLDFGHGVEVAPPYEGGGLFPLVDQRRPRVGGEFEG